MHYKSVGDPAAKTAVVFVHGWSCDMTSWRAQVPAFEGKARVLLVDLPGHGKSDRPDVAYTMDFFAAAVDAVMRDAGVERALLVGLEGTFVASTPESVKADVRRMAAGATQKVAVSAMRAQFDPAIWTDDAIAVPLAVIVAKGPNWSADYFAAVKTLNPAAEIVEIPDAGHFVMMEKPAEVNAALVAFAARAGAVPMRSARPGRPEDVSSPEAIVNAVYDVISGPAGKKRDWDRFRSLFADGARLIPTGPRPAGDWGPRVFDPEGYIRRSEPVFATPSPSSAESTRSSSSSTARAGGS